MELLLWRSSSICKLTRIALRKISHLNQTLKMVRFVLIKQAYHGVLGFWGFGVFFFFMPF